MTDPLNPWQRCACGDLWLSHDVEEYRGDGSEMCCVVGCSQLGCPGDRRTRDQRVVAMLEDMATDLLRINVGAAETAARIMLRLRS